VIQNTVRESAIQLIANQKLYEVLLVDRNGLITEGSRSNVFFVKGEVFYTAQASLILEGITRQKVFECLNELGFQVIAEAVGVNEISRFDAVFLTGTSPNVLPVRSIGNQVFQPQLPSVKILIDHFNDLIAQYILNKKTSGKND
jgi:branched-chain amino acid aminotransferase